MRQPGKNWQLVPAYAVKVDKVEQGRHQTEEASMAYFDFSGEVELAVTFNAGNIDTAKIRPLSYAIQHQVKKKTLFFKLRRPSNLSIEVNGDIFHNLHLFANPPEDFVPDRKDKELIYFGPGIHQIEGGKLLIPSGKTVYLAGGAVVKGQLLIQDAP